MSRGDAEWTARVVRGRNCPATTWRPALSSLGATAVTCGLTPGHRGKHIDAHYPYGYAWRDRDALTADEILQAAYKSKDTPT